MALIARVRLPRYTNLNCSLYPQPWEKDICASFCQMSRADPIPTKQPPPGRAHNHHNAPEKLWPSRVYLHARILHSANSGDSMLLIALFWFSPGNSRMGPVSPPGLMCLFFRPHMYAKKLPGLSLHPVLQLKKDPHLFC